MYDHLTLPSLQKFVYTVPLLPWHLKLRVEVFFIVNVWFNEGLYLKAQVLVQRAPDRALF